MLDVLQPSLTELVTEPGGRGVDLSPLLQLVLRRRLIISPDEITVTKDAPSTDVKVRKN